MRSMHKEIDFSRLAFPSEPLISDEENIDPHWKSMESRVMNRKLKKKGEGPSGRSRVPPSEEEYWLEAGVYEGNKVK